MTSWAADREGTAFSVMLGVEVVGPVLLSNVKGTKWEGGHGSAETSSEIGGRRLREPVQGWYELEKRGYDGRSGGRRIGGAIVETM